MLHNNRNSCPSRRLIMGSLVVVGLLIGLVLVGCPSSSSGPGTDVPLDVSWQLLGDAVLVQVAVSGGAQIGADIEVAITMYPNPDGIQRTAFLTVAQATRRGMVMIADLDPGIYQLLAGSDDRQINFVGGRAIRVLRSLEIGTPIIGDPPADPVNFVDTDGAGDDQLSLLIHRPARDAYKISLDTAGLSSAVVGIDTLTLDIADPDNPDQSSRRLYFDPDRTKTLGATEPVAYGGAQVYTFLPGDDGADRPSGDYELIWRNDDSEAVDYPSQLDAATTYTLTIDDVGNAGVNWKLRIEFHDLPRLPANIPTTFRGRQDGNAHVNDGQGFYLIYNPTAEASRISLQVQRAANSDVPLAFAAGPTSIIRPFVGDQDGCTASTFVTNLANGSIGALPGTPVELSDAIDQPIYCLFFDSGAGGTQPIADVGTVVSSNPDNAFGRRSGHFVFTLLSEAAE